MRPFARIHNRLLVAFLFVVIAPLCVVGVYSIRNTTAILERGAVDALWQETFLKAGQVEKFLSQVRGDLYFISQSRFLKTYVEGGGAETAEESALRRRTAARNLAEFMERFPSYRRILYIDENGTERIRVERTAQEVRTVTDSAESFARAPFFAGAMRLFAGEIHVAAENGAPGAGAARAEGGFLFSTRIFSSAMARKGILTLEVSSERVAELLRGAKNEGLEGTALLDMNGEVLLSTGRFPYPRLIEGTLAGPAVRRILSGAAGVAADPRGEILAFTPVFPLPDKPKTFWVVTTATPKKEILSGVRSYKKVFALILVAALGLAALLSSFFARKLTVPLTTVVQGTRLLGEGNLSHRTAVRTGDEIEDLSHAFNTMAARLHEFYTSLEEKVAEKTAELRRANVELERRQADLRQAYDELKETHQKLQDSERELIQSEKLSSIGRLAASVAHEINNPIGIISLYSQLLKEDLDRPESLKKLDLIIQHAQKVALITKDLLDFSRKTRAQFRSVPAGALLRASLESAQAGARSDSVRVRMNIPDDQISVSGDEGQLVQVFANLIANACQAMPEGGDLTLSAEPTAEGAVRIGVRDTGTGIAPEHLDKIFEPFFTTKPAGVGTGLGLSVCYGIIKSHKGQISVASKPGEGTVFTVELPRA